jgi:CBS domain-containing protein
MASIKSFKVKDVMKETDQVASSDQRISEILGQMKKQHIHELPVIEKGKVIGIIDLDKLIKSRRLPLTSEVKHIMVNNPAISTEDSLPTVARIMISSDLKGIPVVEKGKLIGMVSRADLIAKMPFIDEFRNFSLPDVMTPEPMVVKEDDGVEVARRMMHDLDERAVPVIGKSGLVTGMVEIFSLMHLIEMGDASKMSKDKEIRGRKKGIPGGGALVRDIMKATSTALGKKSSITDLVDMMRRTGSTTIVVTDKEMPVGIITQWDLLGAIAAMEEREGVQVQITGFDHQDAGVFDGMYGLVQKFVEKIHKNVQPTMLHIHGVEHMKEGEAVRYDLSVRLVTKRTSYTARKENYNLFDALEDCIYVIEHQVTKESDVHKKDRQNK